MAECVILGMKLDVAPEDYLVRAQPISGFVVVKAICEDGEVRYLTGATEGLNSIECLGMADYAATRLRGAIQRADAES